VSGIPLGLMTKFYSFHSVVGKLLALRLGAPSLTRGPVVQYVSGQSRGGLITYLTVSSETTGFPLRRLLRLSGITVEVSCLLFKTQINCIGLTVPNMKHITSLLRTRQLNRIFRFMTRIN
jgi:hypothetical protein